MSLRLLLAVALLVAGSARSTDAQQPLTLSDAVRTALDRNPALRAAASAAAEARLHAAGARAALLPRVVFSESWQRSDAPVFAFSSLLSARRFSAEHLALTSLNHPRPVTLFRAALGIEQRWFDGEQRFASRQAALGASVADAERDEAAAMLALAVTQAFGRIVSADATARAGRAAHAAATEDLARAEHRRDLGLATDADVLSVSVHLADLQQRVIQASGDAAVARAELNRLMGAPVAGEFDVVEPLHEAFADEPSLDVLLADADAHRPELRRATLQEQIASAERTRARAALLPGVVTQAVVDLNGTSFRERSSAWAVGGELRWSFSLGGAETAALNASMPHIARARALTEDTRGSVHVEVVTAFRRLESARARLVAGESAVDQAREQHRIIRDRFDAGLSTVNDVLQGSAAVLAAESNRTAAFVDAVVSRAQLVRAVGRVSQ